MQVTFTKLVDSDCVWKLTAFLHVLFHEVLLSAFRPRSPIVVSDDDCPEVTATDSATSLDDCVSPTR